MIPLSIVIDARHYSVCETLRSGLQVQIRAMRPDDVTRIEQAFSTAARFARWTLIRAWLWWSR
jgi:hypothetical protein